MVDDLESDRPDQEPHGCWEVIDAYLWSEMPYTRLSRSRQHLQGSCIGQKLLFTYRIVACFIMWNIFFLQTYYDFVHHGHWQVKFFTNWGIYMTTFLFSLLVAGHILDSKARDLRSCWQMWKWCTAVFQITWLWNFIITTIFWSLIFPFEDLSQAAPLLEWLTYVDHISPFTLVTIDWCLNRMRFEQRFIWLNLILALVYGAVNLTVTKVSGEPIYPPFITWDTPLHWFIGLMLIPWFALYFYIEFFLTQAKLKVLPDFKNQELQRSRRSEPQPDLF